MSKDGTHIYISNEDDELDAKFPEAGSEKDSYAIFTLVSYQLLKPGGILAFIIPNSWLTTAGYASFREWMLTSFEILELIHVWKVFLDVNHDACMLIARKRQVNTLPAETEITVIHRVPRGLSEQVKWQRIAEENWETTFTARPSTWSKEPAMRFETIYSPGVAAAIDKLFRGAETLVDVADITVGVQVYHYPQVSKADIKQRIFHSKTRNGKDWYPIITGNEVQRYSKSQQIRNSCYLAICCTTRGI